MVLNISQNKDNQTMKLGQLIEYFKRNIFLQKFTESKAGRLVPGLFLFYQKAEYEASGLQVSFNIFQ